MPPLFDDDDPDVVAVRKNIFALLIRGHAELAHRENLRSASPLALRFNRLLAIFAEAYVAADAEEKAASQEHRAIYSRLLSRFGEARDRYRVSQKPVADDFNILAVLQLTYKEIRHSMVLAWVLDHDLSKYGTHAQGPLGFKLFLDAVQLPQRYSSCRYWVRREQRNDDSIIDLEIAARGQFLIHIENKIWSSEGEDQTNREWADVRRRAIELGINPDQPNAPVHAFFLTPHGTKPANPNFMVISWVEVTNVLRAFADQSAPPDVKLFALHYARGISRFITVQEKGTADAEATTE